MTRTTGNRFSDNSGSIGNKIDTYVSRITRRRTLDSQTRVFLGLVLGQAVKQTGCSSSELCYLSDTGKAKVRATLANLEHLGVLRMSAVRNTIPTKAKNFRINVPSSWGKGKTIERIGGMPVPLYELAFAGREIILRTLQSVEKITFEELTSFVENRIDKVSDAIWQKYLSFGRVMLSEIKFILLRSEAAYGEYMTQELLVSVNRSLKYLETIESNLQDRSYVIDLIESVKKSLTRLTLRQRIS